MAPTPSGTTTASTPRRQSCDRCHGQKLRCTRSSNSETGACNRCLRQGAQCVYSSSLPKGRPSMYRLAEASASNRRSPPSSNAPSVSPELRRRNHSTTPTTDLTKTADAVTVATVTAADANGNVVVGSNVNEDPSAPTSMLHHVTAPMDTSGATTSCAWPWLAPMNWNEMQVDGSEHESNLSNHSNPPHDGPFLDCFPSVMGWNNCPGSREGDSGRGAIPTHGLDTGFGGCAGGSVGGGGGGGGGGCDLFENIMTIDKKSPDVGIAELSQLSTRLYPLHRSSCALAETAALSQSQAGHSPQRPLIDDSAFKSVAAWLVRVSANMNLLFQKRTDRHSLDAVTTGDTLNDAFSASHHLLEILHCLTGTSSPCTAGDFWGSMTPQSAQSNEFPSLDQGKPSPSRSSQASNTVVRHLVIACHTMLLNIYVAVLIALQHDADLWTSCLPSDYVDAAALADIRLVLIVQLCSYLIERQHQSVDLFFNQSQSQQQSSQLPEPSPPASISSSGTSANREVMSDLEMEVQQRLVRLRQTLRI